jgi:hypothetical protein
MVQSARSVASQSPAIAPRPAPHRPRSFLSDVKIDYGPPDVLSRLFLKADTELREAGVTFSFAPLDEFIDVNKRNSDTWRPSLPIFDPDVGGVTSETGFAMLGRNESGEVVVAQASRLYSLTRSTLKDEIESLRLFYADPDKSRLPGESMSVTAPSAASMVGRVVFSGGVWFHPNYRRKGIVNIIARAARACAFTRWYADSTCSFMAEDVVKGGTAIRAGYPHVEWDVMMTNTPVLRDKVIRAALIWTDVEEQMKFFRSYLVADSQVDHVVDDRAANQKLAS